MNFLASYLHRQYVLTTLLFTCALAKLLVCACMSLIDWYRKYFPVERSVLRSQRAWIHSKCHCLEAISYQLLKTFRLSFMPVHLIRPISATRFNNKLKRQHTTFKPQFTQKVIDHWILLPSVNFFYFLLWYLICAYSLFRFRNKNVITSLIAATCIAFGDYYLLINPTLKLCDMPKRETCQCISNQQFHSLKWGFWYLLLKMMK